MNRTKLILGAIMLAAGCQTQVQTVDLTNGDDGCFGLAPQIQNIGGRQTVCLDGDWKAFVDQYETGYYDYRRKGLVSEKGERKLAFETYRRWRQMAGEQ